MTRVVRCIVFIFLTGTLFSLATAAYAKESHAKLSAENAAAFALLVYHEKANQPPIPAGFTLLCQCPLVLQNKNYYGEAYYRLESGTVTVVITHRGTALNLNNLADNLLIAFKKAPTSFLMSSKPFTDYVLALIFAKFPVNNYRYQFIHVGHSLGAIHAELNYAYQQQHEKYSTSAISFESPGSKEAMEWLIFMNILPENALVAAKENIEIINTDINLINSFNQQAGSVWRINSGYHVMNTPKINLSPIDFKYFATFFTADQHSIVRIYNYFKNGGSFSDGEIYPVGMKKAFKYYKTYNPDRNEGHRDYWDQAFLSYWESHKEIHAGYNNDFAYYREYMVRRHLS